MNYRVLVLPRADDQLVASAQWWSERHSSVEAIWWLDGFRTALEGLCVDPERLPLAREDQFFPFTVRQLLYGPGRKKTHRALFEVRDDEVLVFAVRHLHQRDVSPEDD